MILGGTLFTDKVFIGRDFNGHIGASPNYFDDVHVSSGFAVRNYDGTLLELLSR